MGDSGQGQRLFARVEAFVPVRLRPLSDEQACALARHVGTFASVLDPALDVPPPPAGDTTWERTALVAILARMERLERRMAELARGLEPAEAEEAWIAGETRLLSGSGLAVLTDRRLPPESSVELEISLPGEAVHAVRAVGRIVSSAGPDGDTVPVGRYRLGVAFTGISPADREALVHFSFRLQRAQLRERRGE